MKLSWDFGYVTNVTQTFGTNAIDSVPFGGWFFFIPTLQRMSLARKAIFFSTDEECFIPSVDYCWSGVGGNIRGLIVFG